MAFVDNPNAWRTAQGTDIIPEHLLDTITTISPMRTPWLSTLVKMRARHYEVKFVTDELAGYGNPENGNDDVQAIAENTDADFDPIDGPYQIFNRIHGFRETKSVSDRMNYVETIAVEDAFAAQIVKGIKEQARRIEFALYHSLGQAPSGSGNQSSPSEGAAKMFGMKQVAEHGSAIAAETGWTDLPSDLQGTSQSEGGSPAGYLSEEVLGDIMASMWAKGAVPSDLWMDIVQKRYVAEMSGNSTRNIQAADRALVHTIDVYEGPTGVVIVNLHPVVPDDEVLLTETSLLEIAVLKPTIAELLARTGDAYKGMVETVLTFIPRCPAALGIITDLLNTFSTPA